MSKALIVGINDYPGNELKCCVNDATALANIIDTNHIIFIGFINSTIWENK